MARQRAGWIIKIETEDFIQYIDYTVGFTRQKNSALLYKTESAAIAAADYLTSMYAIDPKYVSVEQL